MLAIAVQQDAAGAAKPFLQHRTGHPRVVACQQTGRMELHHHVAERQPGTKRHGKAIHRLVAGRGVVAVHGRPATGGHENRFRPNQPEDAAAHADQHTGKPVALPAGDEGDGAVFLQPFDRAATTCSMSRLMISIPVRSPLWTVRSAVCPAKAF